MKKLTKLLPEWSKLIYKGLEYDETETFRTIRHVFRSLWTYYAIMNGNFESNVKKGNINLLQKDLEKIFRFRPDFFPLLLLYHDIGRPFNREWHTLESAKIIQQAKVFQSFDLSPIQNLILTGVIRHHLLPGTIFTGESSYFGAISLYKDKSLRDIWASHEYIDILFHSLMVFTIIDIWGYDYSKIFDHYFSHYNQIRDNLIRVFSNVNSIDRGRNQMNLYQEFSKIDKLNLKWRVACALRIFQFVNTQSYLTEEFYFTKIDEGLNAKNQSWEEFSSGLGNVHSLVQFKYALPLMMVLASGNFVRKPFDPEEKINPRIFDFWQTCTNIVKSKQSIKNTPSLWNFIFNLPRGWFFESKHVKYVLSDKFLKTIIQSTVEFDSKMESYLINIR
ncbi:MAG: hypothetical protein ACFFDK_14440 [Promethearchaeota archaeon]